MEHHNDDLPSISVQQYSFPPPDSMASQQYSPSSQAINLTGSGGTPLLSPRSSWPALTPRTSTFSPYKPSPTVIGEDESSEDGQQHHYRLRRRHRKKSMLLLPPLEDYIPARAARHPFAPKNFEPPPWRRIFVHVLLCAVAYPVLFVSTLVVQHGVSLFLARLVVSLFCGLVGAILGVSLVSLGRPFLEAATWATVIHQSQIGEHGSQGVKLKDLAKNSINGTSAWPALKLIHDRYRYPGTSRKSRSEYDRRPWSLFIIFFIFILAVAGSLPFILGRLITINVTFRNQRDVYEEVAISGDNSDTDISHASDLRSIFENFALTWTLAPLSSQGPLPQAVTFKYGNDTIYFAETTKSQLLPPPRGRGFGTFDTEKYSWAQEAVARDDANTTNGDGDGDADDKNNGNNDGKPDLKYTDSEIDANRKTSMKTTVNPGAVLRFPKWGTRLHCASIPNLTTNLVPRSGAGYTYLFIPTSVVQSLIDSFSFKGPTEGGNEGGIIANMGSLLLPAPGTFSPSSKLAAGDTLPSGLDVKGIIDGVAVLDNGVAHTLYSKPLLMGTNGTGFVSMEAVLVRLNTTYTPNGTFPVFSTATVVDASGNNSRIGYDAAVCVRLVEPWLVEVYNGTTTGVPGSVRLVQRGTDVSDVNVNVALGAVASPDTSGTLEEEKRIGKPVSSAAAGGAAIRTGIDSKRLSDVYVVAHQNSINQMSKDNGRDAFYVPSQTVLSFTDDGFGAFGYTILSPSYFARARGIADASNMLSFFAGTGQVVARRFLDRTVANAEIHPIYLLLVCLVCVALIGIVAGLAVPKLPLGAPRRGFELYTWMAAFHAGELVGANHMDPCSDIVPCADHDVAGGSLQGDRGREGDVEKSVGNSKDMSGQGQGIPEDWDGTDEGLRGVDLDKIERAVGETRVMYLSNPRAASAALQNKEPGLIL